jgi:hypothetical protein
VACLALNNHPGLKRGTVDILDQRRPSSASSSCRRFDPRRVGDLERFAKATHTKLRISVEPEPGARLRLLSNSG